MKPTAKRPQAIRLTPVGVVRNGIKRPSLNAVRSNLELAEKMHEIKARQREIKRGVSELVISPALKGILEGVEGFSHILVLYWPHLIDPERRKLLKVNPMGRKDLPKRGIFATCSPARPNPILVSAVKLLERKGNILRVRGLEAVDGSPIIDIKPYSRHYYRIEKPTVPEWMAQIHREIRSASSSSGLGRKPPPRKRTQSR
ncbi:MAG: tRNA (N6-threonylcarbamoyladenosine(37)-N6)-methyltransferase TrmO [Deltaproteobacteria bacterium]|nr:tRNA (N6-threonylcarbamoyladenosine(37)-N6)-methyltransferase TrmO [Deltaproteobacteria bacterium]